MSLKLERSLKWVRPYLPCSNKLLHLHRLLLCRVHMGQDNIQQLTQDLPYLGMVHRIIQFSIELILTRLLFNTASRIMCQSCDKTPCKNSHHLGWHFECSVGTYAHLYDIPPPPPPSPPTQIILRYYRLLITFMKRMKTCLVCWLDCREKYLWLKKIMRQHSPSSILP